MEGLVLQGLGIWFRPFGFLLRIRLGCSLLFLVVVGRADTDDRAGKVAACDHEHGPRPSVLDGALHVAQGAYVRRLRGSGGEQRLVDPDLRGWGRVEPGEGSLGECALLGGG